MPRIIDTACTIPWLEDVRTAGSDNDTVLGKG